MLEIELKVRISSLEAVRPAVAQAQCTILRQDT